MASGIKLSATNIIAGFCGPIISPVENETSALAMAQEVIASLGIEKIRADKRKSEDFWSKPIGPMPLAGSKLDHGKEGAALKATLSLRYLPGVLEENGYVIHAFDWEKPFQSGALISVGEKIDSGFVKQVANVTVKDGRVRFWTGNGFTVPGSTIFNPNAFFSTFLEDCDYEKFILDFKSFVSSMIQDPRSKGGYLITPLNEF